MQNVLLVVQLLLAIALIGVILIQRTSADGGGLTGGGGGGTMGGLFTARGSANLLTRTTAALATLFIVNSLVLGAIASSEHRSKSLVDQIAPLSAPAEPAKTPSAPVAPQVPLAK
ncbi:MAG: preprotein translocase subunit SecG [Alphaproteobacteria bacterium]|nr:preprotein translocase subunit SecG [Alphaproteobacteria bacterium]